MLQWWYHLGLTFGDFIFRRDVYFLPLWLQIMHSPLEAVFVWQESIQNAVVWKELRLWSFHSYLYLLPFSMCGISWKSLNL